MQTKYPRTPHLPWSPGFTADDVEMTTLPWSLDDDVVITEKMDGENTTIGKNYVHARSVESGYHPSRTWVNRYAAEWQYALPEAVRIVGENLYAKHSIHYTDLDSYFLGFAAFDEDACLSWDETLDLFSVLGIKTVPVCYRGHFEGAAEWMENHRITEGREEGYVIRSAKSFGTDEFREHVAKYVRANHVNTPEHWLTAQIIKNGLK